MKQTYHSNSTTNIRLRREINQEKGSCAELSQKYNVSKNTILKWKNRTEFKDKSSKPKNIKHALTQLQMRVALTIRHLTWMPLDEVAEAMNPKEPEKIRSAIYRTFLRHKVNKVTQKVKEYEPGYLHIDVTYLPKIGKKSIIFLWQ